MIVKYWSASGSGSPPSFLPPSLWNIVILLHKQAKRRTIMHTTVYRISVNDSFWSYIYRKKLVHKLDNDTDELSFQI